jgi:hypothetical protein
MSTMRKLGHFAGGVAGGYLAGSENQRRKQTSDMQGKVFDSQTKFYDEMAGLAQKYPTLSGMISQGAPTGGVPANAGGVEVADQQARTAAPPGAAPSALAQQLVAPAEPTPMLNPRPVRRLPFQDDMGG